MKEDFLFTNFRVTAYNMLAYSASRTVAEMTDNSYNPLVIYGQSYCGKTHLLKAIEEEVKAKHPDKTVKYISAFDFTAVICKNLDSFFKRTNPILENDVLLIDDASFFMGRETTQCLLAELIDYLIQKGTVVVIAMCCNPEDMPELMNPIRLIKSSLVADITAKPEREKSVFKKVVNHSLFIKIKDFSSWWEPILADVEGDMTDLEIGKVIAVSDEETGNVVNAKITGIYKADTLLCQNRQSEVISDIDFMKYKGLLYRLRLTTE